MIRFDFSTHWLLFCSPFYAEACNELAVLISASQLKGNTATCLYVEAVANRLQHCVKYGRSRT